MISNQQLQQQHNRRGSSYLPPNIILAMIDGVTDETNDYDQVLVTVDPPTIAIPIPDNAGHGSQESLPDPPTGLSSVTLITPVPNNNGNHHYESIDSKTEVTTTVTKMIDAPKSRKGCSKCCSFWCVILGTMLISLAVFVLVWNCQFFGYCSHGPGDRFNGSVAAAEMGQGNNNLTEMEDFYGITNLANSNNTSTLALTSSSLILSALTTSSPTTTISATTSTKAIRLHPTNLTYPFGWRRPIKNVTVSELRGDVPDTTAMTSTVTSSSFTSTTPTSTSTSTTTTTTTTTPSTTPSTTTTPLPTTTTTLSFEEKDKNVFGNMSILLSDKSRFVVSPYLLNYMLSFIGKFGDASTKAVIADNYFGVTDINQLYDYFTNLKYDFYASKSQTAWFLLNAFISGDNPSKPPKKFMEEIVEVDRIPVYPSSPDHSYETYYNEMIKKNIYDKNVYNRFFVNEELQTSAKKVVGFSHLQSSLKFKWVRYNKIQGAGFMGDGKNYKVNMFVTASASEDFPEHRLYQIPFTDDRYTFFIVHNRWNTSIPNVNPKDIIKAIKAPSSANKKDEVVCVPEINQQNTYDLTKFINLSAGKELSIAFERPLDSQILDKYYQAIRFDINAEGLNMKTREHQPFTFKCHEIDQTFIYGVFFKDTENPSREALLYYGLFV